MSAGYMRRCAGKKQYPDRNTAHHGRALLAERKGMNKDRLSVYRCDQCLTWHVGGSANSFVTRAKTGKRANKRMRGRV